MPRGRPKKKIDLDDVRELASEGNTQADIADALGFARSTFGNRPDLREAYQKGLSEMRLSLRHFQYNAARDGNVQMLIWLGKQFLKQRENVETEIDVKIADDGLSKSLRDLAKDLSSDD